MKKLTLLLVVLLSVNLFANNIKVSNATIEARDTVNQTRFFTFDLSWDNSWRNDLDGQGKAEPYNWDAAWVFIKYARFGQGYASASFAVDSSKHVAPLGCKIKPAPDGKGVFIYRSQNGEGNINFQNIKLLWEYGKDGAATGTYLGDSIIGFQVFAIEMVYIPKGDNFVGDPAGAGGPSNCFYIYNGNGAFHIRNEDSILFGKSTGKLYTTWTSTADNKVIPAVFPKGYNAFYTMKYEGTNQLYVDFLNNISPTQQARRDDYITADNPNGNRGGIYKEDNIFKTTHPDRVTFNLSLWDGIAFYDWAGLRVMTDFEYEKACRGLSPAVSHEYAWGSTVLYQPTATRNKITSSSVGVYEDGSEVFSDSVNCNINYNGTLYKPDNTTKLGTGPLRSGIFAKPTSNRFWSGAAYTGVMDMSGNAYELTLNPHEYSVGTMSNYNGTHGDGLLATNGDCDIPTLTSDYAFYNMRGGNFASGVDNGKIAHRLTVLYYYNCCSHTYNVNIGIRGIRTAP